MKAPTIKKLVLLIFTATISSISFGQIYDDSFNLTAESIRLAPVPNSPEAQAFTKYGNTPVNLYTGSPNISIPIYTYKGREIDLPISLTYDASGIKVEQLANQVGLGWNLNVGGRISRIVNGMPDDFHLSSHTYGPYKSLWDTEVNSGIIAYDDISSNPSFNTQAELIDYMYFLKKTDEGEYDTQPDYFSFNALGNSDMFTIDVVSKTPKSLDNSRLKVSITKAFGGANTPITKWVVTTDDGTKYTFEEEEVTKDTNLNDIGEFSVFGMKKEYNSSWLLSKIESANNKDVYEFTYTPYGSDNRVANNVIGVTNIISVQNGAPQQTPTPTNLMGYSNTEYVIDQKILSKITHNGKVIVDVDLLANRWDMNANASAIEKINIYDNHNTTTNVKDLHKSYTFNYDYFRTSNAPVPPYNSGNAPNPILLRLMLESLDVNDKNNNQIKSYTFDYETPYAMPPTSSLAQDYYGYYNGATLNTVLYPTYSHPYVPNNGANRSSNFSFSKRGTLKKITYPTGGYTNFEYEPNYEKEITGSTTTWQNVASVSMVNPSLPAYNLNACNAIFPFPTGQVTPATLFDTFEVTSNQTDYKIIYDQSGSLGKNFTVEKVVSIVKIASPTATLSWTDIYDNNCNVKAGVDVVWNSLSLISGGMTPVYPYTTTITLDSGHYQVILANPSSNFTNSVDVEKGTIVNTYTYNEKAGIRIKSIKDYSDASTLTLHKSYEYPSGTVISEPRHTYTSTQFSLDSGGLPVQSTILHRLSYAGGTDKPHIGYSSVVETTIDANGNTNGKTIHEFNTTNSTNYKSGIYTYYINGKETAKQYGVSYELGKSKGKTIYDKNDIVVASSTNAYYDKEYYNNTGIYLHVDESKSDLWPIPHLSPTGKWKISYIPYDKGSNLYSPSLNIGSMSGGVQLHRPSECVDTQIWNNINDAHELCWPNVGRLLKQTSKAWGKFGAITNASSKQYYNAAADIVEQITSYTYYDEDLVTYPIPNKPAVILPANFLLKDTQTTNSKGETLKQEFLYADHLSTTGAGSLKSKNMVAIPLETKVYKGTSLMSYKKTHYSGTLPSKIQTAKGTAALEDRLLYERFEAGNLVQVKQVNGASTAYIWGYDNRYVIAKIENATYAQIESLSAFGNGFTITENLTTTQETQLRALSNTLVTTYIYDPMVGVTSTKDPRGNITTFEYDDFHRLKQVKDKDGNILSKNEYNYAN